MKALEVLKKINPLYENVKINRNFEFGDDKFTLLDENDNIIDPDKNRNDDHLLTLDLQSSIAIDIDTHKPAGTGFQSYIMKDLKGNIIL